MKHARHVDVVQQAQAMQRRGMVADSPWLGTFVSARVESIAVAPTSRQRFEVAEATLIAATCPCGR